MLPNLQHAQVDEAEGSVARWDAMTMAAPGDGGDTAPVLVVSVALHKYQGTLYLPGQHYAAAAVDVAGLLAREAIHVPAGASGEWWTKQGRILSPFDDPEVTYASAPSAGSLTIVQGCGYDPGSAAYRLHSAINAASKHASAFVRFYDTNPHCSLRQWDGIRDAHAVRELLLGADVVHCHVSYLLANNSGIAPRADQTLVIHYHGSSPDGVPLCAATMPGTNTPLLAWDVMRGAKVMAARLTLVNEIKRTAEALSLDISPQWSPIPVDVARYRALVAGSAWDGTGTFRLAHSPTNRSFKGSAVLERVIERLQAQGLPVELVLIQKMTHGEALELKATCHATFDSFWLGMQGSGLEAAAMGQPVIAGDPDAREAHVALVGECPWTYANHEDALGEAIERLVTDAEFYAGEASRVATFVERHHDYPAVARRYEDSLTTWGHANARTESGESDRTPVQVRSDLPKPRRHVTRKRKAA